MMRFYFLTQFWSVYLSFRICAENRRYWRRTRTVCYHPRRRDSARPDNTASTKGYTISPATKIASALGVKTRIFHHRPWILTTKDDIPRRSLRLRVRATEWWHERILRAWSGDVISEKNIPVFSVDYLQCDLRHRVLREKMKARRGIDEREKSGGDFFASAKCFHACRVSD